MHQSLRPSLKEKICLAIAVITCLAFVSRPLFADTIDEYRAKISALEAQINQLNSSYNKTTAQANTLKNAVAALELNKTKLAAQLKLTTTKISTTSLTLNQIAGDIVSTEAKIDKSSTAVAQSIRVMDEAESQSVVQQLLNQHTISEAWDYVNGLRAVQARLSADLADLNDLHTKLAEQKTSAEKERTNLLSLQKNLTGQKQAVEYTQQEKDKLLTQTKNDAAKYQAQLAEAAKQKDIFEKELADYEDRLGLTVDTSLILAPRHGVFSWPLDDIYITQYFGKTAAAAKLYKTTGKHGGVDFRATIGTPVYAALSGTVTEVATQSKYLCQYGKFVLIKHANGLSTIYGHLSVVSVKAGDVISARDVIGLSGNTGYSTGQHLHFGVYATQGISVIQDSGMSKSQGGLGDTSCKGIKTVAARPEAYLDPLAYLPSL